MEAGPWTVEPCDWDAAAVLSETLALGETTASVLVRRGFADPEAAARFLAAEPPGYDPFLLGDMREAVARLQLAVERGERVCVHGDYDVDGICATAVATLALREAGLDVRTHLPSRFEEGYGLARDTLDRLAADGVTLVVTVDCGITALAEVAHARTLGLDVIVTDHHRPGETLPDCPVVATRTASYPFPELAGTGVAHRLAEALLGSGHPLLDRLLDLVALATIADVVPLVDENRAFASAGLRALARTSRPGLRALMRSARVDPAAIDATAVSFRLAPRINAAGRLGRPDTALELVLAEDTQTAERLAGELERLNRERQVVEERIARSAAATIDSWNDERRAGRAYVVCGEDWHQGVLGIVASRLVERYRRPVVLIARSADGWKGSGRSIPSFDLHAGLAACAEHLERFGGHRAAAGLSIQTASLEEFAAAFVAHADRMIEAAELELPLRVDAVVPPGALTLTLAEELRRLAPFGLGNPEPTLLVASVEAAEPTIVGEGKHLRFRVRGRGVDGGAAIAFGQGHEHDRLARPGARYDVAFCLQENRWNGSVAPQLVVRTVFDAVATYEELREELGALWRAGEAAWTEDARTVFAELALARGARRELHDSRTFRRLLAERASTAELLRAT
ncbi:MAG: single-stranded-DNA-specific exonuclease RecJ [Thermoleophilia bacterium]|nr:single-stranded-DNA-specific exonuclease RecJ [Thermoleophilia bacterium]